MDNEGLRVKLDTVCGILEEKTTSPPPTLYFIRRPLYFHQNGAETFFFIQIGKKGAKKSEFFADSKSEEKMEKISQKRHCSLTHKKNEVMSTPTYVWNVAVIGE